MSRSSSCAWRIVLACVLVATGSATWGNDPVHKCRGTDGQSHYQSAPCASTQRTEWVRAYPPDPPAPVAAATSPQEARTARRVESPRKPSRTGTRRASASPSGAVISMHRDAAACARAKKARDQTYARLGLKRDFVTSRKLDDRVNAACR
nr:hypothetical protein [uncultured Pseudoxanthomonas sp.]